MNLTIKQIKKIYINNNIKNISAQKNRSKINYSNKKIRQQKGTGKARISTKKSPIFIGGGRTFPSIPNKNTKKINKKMKYYCIYKQIIFYKKINKINYIYIDNKTNKYNSIKNIINNINNNIIIIYKYIYKNFINCFKNFKNIRIVREDKINPITFNKNNFIIIINNSLEWIKKI